MMYLGEMPRGVAPVVGTHREDNVAIWGKTGDGRDIGLSMSPDAAVVAGLEMCRAGMKLMPQRAAPNIAFGFGLERLASASEASAIFLWVDLNGAKFGTVVPKQDALRIGNDLTMIANEIR